MAFTRSHITQSVYGNLRVSYDRITADAAEGAVAVVDRPIIMAFVSPENRATFVQSGATTYTFPAFVENAGTTGTVAIGSIGFSGCVANNIFTVTTYFR